MGAFVSYTIAGILFVLYFAMFAMFVADDLHAPHVDPHVPSARYADGRYVECDGVNAGS